MRFLFLIVLTFCISTNSFAKRSKTINHISVRAAWVSEKPAPRFNGRIYEFEVTALRRGLIIDSVWFGYAPVPCDVWTKNRSIKGPVIEKNKQYIITCNRDLYSQYPDRFDSTRASKPVGLFLKEAMIWYSYQGKRYTCRVKDVRVKKAQSTRQ